MKLSGVQLVFDLLAKADIINGVIRSMEFPFPYRIT
jgi:hypothetical protein